MGRTDYAEGAEGAALSAAACRPTLQGDKDEEQCSGVRTSMLLPRRTALADALPRRDALGGECRTWQPGSQVRLEKNSLILSYDPVCMCVCVCVSG